MCYVGDIVNLMFSNNVNVLYMHTPLIVLIIFIRFFLWIYYDETLDNYWAV
jgi:hypothetical protein